MRARPDTRIQIVFLLLAAQLLCSCRAKPAPTATPLPTLPTVHPTITPSPQDTAPASTADPNTAARLRMVENQIRTRGVSDPSVLAAMKAVPRHLFVPDEWLHRAYDDTPLPIGYGQTISQPYMVAWMTQLLAVRPGDRALEVGTGSGYQAAILAEMGLEVYSMEIIEALAAQASDRLGDMGYPNLTLRHADGYYGWEEHAPFDAIIVTCAPDHVPTPLVQQLADGGRMVLPVGPPGSIQSLWLLEKRGEQVQSTNLGWVSFVPLTGEH
jgi:protein-L-isoaspartate(D-aspartate) O-methyltransferase